MAFGVLGATHIQDKAYFRDNILDPLTCRNLCQTQPASKTFVHNKQNRECHCLKTTLPQFEKHIDKLGAPKDCLAEFFQDSCVSTLITFNDRIFNLGAFILSKAN